MGRSSPEAQSAGFTARYESAWWAITNGLGSEAAAELRALHGIDPKHAPTARMVATLDKLERPGTDPELLEFRKALGISTSIARGPHVVLLHQQTETEAEERVALLDRDHRLLSSFRSPRNRAWEYQSAA